MEKVNVIVKAKNMAVGKGVAEALESSGRINVIYIKEGDVNKEDWEACQKHSAVVAYSNVKQAYEADTSEDEPWGTTGLNFPQLENIQAMINEFEVSPSYKFDALKNIIRKMVEEDLENTVARIEMLPRKGHLMTLAQLMGLCEE